MKRLFCMFFLGIALASQATCQTMPELSSSPLPMYPVVARNARMTGTVKLWFSLDSSGDVTQTEVISGHPVLREAALACVQSWKFDPHSITSTGKRYETEFVYTLGVQEKEGHPKLTISLADFRHVEVISELYTEPIY